MNQNLINIFLDTQEISKSIPNGTTVKYNKESILPAKNWHKPLEHNISVENLDTVSALQKYYTDGKICLLNMASFKRPGGGVERGAKAQEEGLFRCSNLFTSISKEFYPIDIDECLYTDNATFVKDFNYNIISPISADVITIPAINLNENAKYDPVQNQLAYEEVTKNKIRLMLSVPAKNNVKTIILGSWGCGVFKNDPEVMAQFFYDILVNEGYLLYFDKVIFAIINDHNSVGNNFNIFKKIYG